MNSLMWEYASDEIILVSSSRPRNLIPGDEGSEEVHRYPSIRNEAPFMRLYDRYRGLPPTASIWRGSDSWVCRPESR